MSKDSSAKYYQDNKERIQKKLIKDLISLMSHSKEENKKNNKMVTSDVQKSSRI